MTQTAIAQARLASQQISQSAAKIPAELVAWFGAVQAQDYAAANWAVGLRLPQSTTSTVERAIAEKSIIRTWTLRGTLHLMAASDVRWMLTLLRPRLYAAVGSRLRQLDLTAADLAKSRSALTSALEGGKQLTRRELSDSLERAGVQTHDTRLNHLLVCASLDGLICCGVRRGSELTYTLLDEWAPVSPQLEQDDALAELTGRYFQSHGSATLQDFMWWSGLTLAEASSGTDLIRPQLSQESIDEKKYWLSHNTPAVQATSMAVYLLPSFDEYLLGYKDRRAALGSLDFQQIVNPGNGLFKPVVVVDGRVAGTWKRTIRKDTVLIETSLFYPLTTPQQEALTNVVQQFGAYYHLTCQPWTSHLG